MHGVWPNIVLAQILEQLQLPKEAASLTDANLDRAAELLDFVPAGHVIGEPEVLFRGIREDSEIEALRQR